MNYHIDQSNNKSAYMQLYEQIRRDIVEEIYSYGSKMPSKRLLAEESGVSISTAEHTYEILCDEGYLEARQRSGYFVIYRKSDFFQVAETVSHVQIHADHEHSTTGEFPFTVLSKTMRKVLLDYGTEILIKSPNRGCMQLRSAISAYLARSNGMAVGPDQIIIGAGAEYLYGLIIQLLGKERGYAIETPSYEKIRRVYEANEITYEMLKLGKDGIHTSELERAEASVLHVTPYNSFPSGITANVSKRHEYLRWAEKRNGYIIEDNYDSELTVSSKNEDTIFSLAENGSVIYLNTFSKTIAPSIRVGYMVLPEQLLKVFEEKVGFYSCTVPVFEQYVLAELINSGDFERHINRVRRARRRSEKNR